MVEDLNMPVKIDICETLREADGLAMSSRNTYLSASERSVAKILYKALNSAKLKFDGNINSDTTREELSTAVYEILKSEPMVTEVEYVSIASHLNMKELSVVDRAGGAVISSAIRIGSVRLIDNVLLGTAVKDILGR
jgi:pantoate--beta-alanine ligase